MSAPDFTITSNGIVSKQFTALGIHNFSAAAAYIKALPYGRNADKLNPLSVFSDGCGTCGTKHAVLKRLADENNFKGLELVTGIFRMDIKNSPKVALVLLHYNLAYIPEAHNYLRYKGSILDYTFPGDGTFNFESALMEEIVVNPEDIGAAKVALHKTFLAQWLPENPEISYNLDTVWNIREACIKALSGENFINKS